MKEIIDTTLWFIGLLTIVHVVALGLFRLGLFL